tara:strand:+ start:41 stop:439 length:399 start_codon:yes stop_codon:yes gene_type:complete
MIKFFTKYKIIFYLTNICLIFLYLFPGSIFGCIFFDNCKRQLQITPDLAIISSNHFYAFLIISIIGFFTFFKKKELRFLIIYLSLLSILLEISHLIIPERSFQWSDLFGNLIAVIVVILIYNLINKYGNFKK